jgi:uncharacterized protein with ATP-grasp and redox domains
MLCLTRQSLEAARFATDDEAKHAAVFKQTLDIVREKGFSVIPPLLAQEIQRIIRRETVNADPYTAQKQESNELMLALADSLRERIRQAHDPIRAAVQTAIAGNSIDYAVRGDWNKETLRQAFENALQAPINGSVKLFAEGLKHAKQVLYLLDNCGEIVCDQIMIEEIKRHYPHLSVIAAVRGSAVLNDAVLADAESIGLHKTVPVITNGNDAVGTVLEQCSREFMNVFHQSDVIIAKGLANYETLVEYDRTHLPQTVYYLFKAKCAFIAKYAGVSLGDAVLQTRFVPTSPSAGQ